MPSYFGTDWGASKAENWLAAEEHVRKKFPHLHPSLNGYWRAVLKRMGLR